MRAAGDRWWLWTQEHPWVSMAAIVAVIIVIMVLIVVGDYAITSTCDKATNVGLANCMAQGGH